MSAENRSYLDMSDDEISNLDPSTMEQAEEENEVTQEETSAEEAAEDQGSEEGRSPDEDAADPDDADEDKESNEQEKQDDASASDAEDKESTDKEAEPQSKVVTAAEGTEQVDYKAAYERLFTPFKANGRDITVKNVDDAIALMQMGANYNKKMAALKPNLKLMKLLENNGLLDENKLSYLIDLEKKKPDAINKLVQESGLDPLDLDADKASGYKPSTYTVDEREMELDSVLDSLQESPSYHQTLDIVSNRWDGQSKQVIANSPQLLKVIDSHVQSGIYDLISKEIESERVFGRLTGLSDIEAYRQVGDAIQARGGFSHMGTANTQGHQTQAKPVIVQPKPKMGNEDELRAKKLAASSTKPAVAGSTLKDFNPLALSDEEFSKISANNFR